MSIILESVHFYYNNLITIIMTNMIDLYNIHIYNRYNDILISGKTINDLNNYDLSKIFEYYVCWFYFQKNK